MVNWQNRKGDRNAWNEWAEGKIQIFLTAWMFLTPIAVIAEGYRALIIKGVLPDWKGLLWVTLLGLFMGVMGYIWFMKTKKIFADVI